MLRLRHWYQEIASSFSSFSDDILYFSSPLYAIDFSPLMLSILTFHFHDAASDDDIDATLSLRCRCYLIALIFADGAYALLMMLRFHYIYASDYFRYELPIYFFIFFAIFSSDAAFWCFSFALLLYLLMPLFIDIVITPLIYIMPLHYFIARYFSLLLMIRFIDVFFASLPLPMLLTLIATIIDMMLLMRYFSIDADAAITHDDAAPFDYADWCRHYATITLLRRLLMLYYADMLRCLYFTTLFIFAAAILLSLFSMPPDDDIDYWCWCRFLLDFRYAFIAAADAASSSLWFLHCACRFSFSLFWCRHYDGAFIAFHAFCLCRCHCHIFARYAFDMMLYAARAISDMMPLSLTPLIAITRRLYFLRAILYFLLSFAAIADYGAGVAFFD